jgi:malate dehydrogenase (oxaloacetate-decarboxylating)(NADP+)
MAPTSSSASAISRQQSSASASSAGLVLSKDPIRHNGVSTPIELRKGLGIRGLVPAAYIPLELDVERCMEQIAAKKGRPLEQYIYLQGIQDVSERLYFAILTKYTATIMPIVYTPIVGAGT